MQNIKKPSFGAYLLVILLPPFYFFSRKRIASGIISAVLFLVSIPFLFIGIGFIIWAVNALWAAWNLRYELMDVQAQQIAESIAKKKVEV